jgi:hypothetical protein
MNYNAFGDTYSQFEDCYIKGTLMVSTPNILQYDPYILKFRRCRMESTENNLNGQQSNLMLLEYAANESVSKILLEDCLLSSPNQNIFAGDGYGGTGINKYLVAYGNKFENSKYGWIENQNPGMNFKLLDNYTQHEASGSYPTPNMYNSTPGITVEELLEVIL